MPKVEKRACSRKIAEGCAGSRPRSLSVSITGSRSRPRSSGCVDLRALLETNDQRLKSSDQIDSKWSCGDGGAWAWSCKAEGGGAEPGGRGGRDDGAPSRPGLSSGP